MRPATIPAAILHQAAHAPEGGGIVFQDDHGKETRYSFAEVERATSRRAAALQRLGLEPGDRLGLVIVDPEDFVLTFFAAMRAGIVPVPMYPPLSFASLDAYAERTARILASCGARGLVATGSLHAVLWGLTDSVPTLRRMIKAEDLRAATGDPVLPSIRPDDVAFLQYTSGSTADPKGVVVRHANLIANVEGIARASSIDASATGVSWLPLYHDMGLIGFVVNCVVTGMSLVLIPTTRFLKKPTTWMEALHAHRGTHTFAPNFAYALVTRRAKPEDLARWDLSSVRLFGCGAEPIQAGTARAFLETFAAARMRPDAFTPAYGMAEATLAMSFKPRGEELRTRFVDAARFQAERACVEPQTGQPVLEHVSCGPPFDGHEVRIVGDGGDTLPDGVEGEIWFRGPSVCGGYFGNDEATREAFRSDGWLVTGDLGYVHRGEIYVTGRKKDLVIVNGRNLHPQEIEWVASEVEGVRKGNVVAFSRPGAASEELVLALEVRPEAEREALAAAVKQRVQRDLGAVVAEVVLLEPGMLPKTSSGKLQRRRTRDDYLAGRLGTSGSRLVGANDHITFARHVAWSMWSRAKAAMLWKAS